MPITKIENRLKAFLIIIIIIFAILSSRLGYLQILHSSEYQHLAEGNRIRLITQRAPRGQMFDAHNKPMVATRYAYTVSLVPMEIDDMESVVDELSPLLNMSKKDIMVKVEETQKKGLPSYYPIRIQTDVSNDILVKIEEKTLELPGVMIEEQPVRDYVEGDFASHLIGYVGEINDKELKEMKTDGYGMGDIIGKNGLEKLYDQLIRGEDGGQQVEVDNRGRPVKVLGQKMPIPGNDLYLTIDKDVQAATEKSLRETMEHVQRTGFPDAQAAGVVAINPKNGAILAMSSKPSFDPNLFVGGVSSTPEKREAWKQLNSSKWHPFTNRVISGEYPPGSTFKPLMAIAALEEGKTTPDEYINDASGIYWRIAPKKCWKTGGHGKVNISDALQVSCNIYFYEMGYRLGIDNISKYAKMFGLGEKTGFDLPPGEKTGLVPTREWRQERFSTPWQPAETLDAAIGQGFHNYTPLQIANYIATLANGGTLYRPYVVNKIATPDGEIVKRFGPQITRQLPISKKNIEIVKKGMERVTQPGGTAYAYFKDFPFPVAGKTGTAQNPHGDDHGWFVCFAPVDDPQIAIAVVVEQGGHGGSAAGPIARAMMDAFFHVEKEEAENVPSQPSGQSTGQGEQQAPTSPQVPTVPAQPQQPSLPSNTGEPMIPAGESEQPLREEEADIPDTGTEER